jgi:hypothetical protein
MLFLLEHGVLTKEQNRADSEPAMSQGQPIRAASFYRQSREGFEKLDELMRWLIESHDMRGLTIRNNV